MIVTMTRGDGTTKVFTHVKTIIHSKEKFVIMTFSEGHPYPANEVYLGFDDKVKTFSVEVD